MRKHRRKAFNKVPSVGFAPMSLVGQTQKSVRATGKSALPPYKQTSLPCVGMSQMGKKRKQQARTDTGQSVK